VARTPLAAVELIAACIWVGSLVCLAVVANAARDALDRQSQVALFRSLGRRYGVLGSASLLVAIGAGLALAWPPSSWTATIDAAVALAGLLLLATVAGMAQARAMTATRQRALRYRGDAAAEREVNRGRVVAAALRGTMAVITLAIVVLVAQVLTR
jgi:hypothetical protein